MTTQKSKTPVSGLEDHLGYWLRHVSNHVSQAFRERLAAEGVTPAEWVVLRQLFTLGPVAPSRIADASGWMRGTVSKLVDRLAAKGLVGRTLPGGDKRFQQVGLTAEGKVRVPVLARIADANDHAFFSALSPAERDGLMALMRELVRRHGLRGVPVD